MVISSNARVESLAKSGIDQIPKEFIRTQDELTTITNIFDEEKNQKGPQVPTIDLNDINSNDPKTPEKCGHELLKAATEWGVMHLVNHGISSDLIYRVKVAGESFFNQPVEEKEKYCNNIGSGKLQGYGSKLRSYLKKYVTNLESESKCSDYYKPQRKTQKEYYNQNNSRSLSSNNLRNKHKCIKMIHLIILQYMNRMKSPEKQKEWN